MELIQLIIFVINFWQQSGGTMVMDADATSALHKRGVAPTDDTFKFTWFQVIFFAELLFPCLF